MKKNLEQQNLQPAINSYQVTKNLARKHKTYWLLLNIDLSKRPVDLGYLKTNWLYFDSSFQSYFFVNRITTQLNFAFRIKNWWSTFTILSKSSDLWVEYNWQCKRKCSVISNLKLLVSKEFNVSLKPCWNLCSFN